MKTFLVSDNEALNPQIRDVLRKNLLECPDSNVIALGMSARAIENSGAKLIVLVLSPDPTVALGCLRTIRRVQQAPVLAVGPASEPTLILRTLQDGANDFVDEAELEANLTKSIVNLQRQTGQLLDPGQVITVLGVSGGSGSSTLASNLATALATEHKRCSLIDLNLQSGDLGALLSLEPEHSLADICENLDRLDRNLFEQVITHHETGVDLLASPRVFTDQAERGRRGGGGEQRRPVTAAGVEEAIKMARKLFPFIVVDIDHSLSPNHTAALTHSDVILVVLRLDFTCVLNARMMLDHLNSMGIPAERIKLVVNRYGQPKESSLADAETVLGMKIEFQIPNDPKRVNRANNVGTPIVLANRRCGVAKSIMRIAAQINGKDEQEEEVAKRKAEAG